MVMGPLFTVMSSLLLFSWPFFFFNCFDAPREEEENVEFAPTNVCLVYGELILTTLRAMRFMNVTQAVIRRIDTSTSQEEEESSQQEISLF